MTETSKDLVVLITSEDIGRGDEKLGMILMAAFLDTLSQFRDDLSHVLFTNGGAKLVVDGSPVLDQLKQLESVGAKILTCGTCLNYFNIKDNLKVGTVSNMVEIIETLSKAGRVIRP